MDKWSEKEVQKVRAGGNKNFREFLEAYDDYMEEWTIEEKYNSMVPSFSENFFLCFSSLQRSIATKSQLKQRVKSGLKKKVQFSSQNKARQ